MPIDEKYLLESRTGSNTPPAKQLSKILGVALLAIFALFPFTAAAQNNAGSASQFDVSGAYSYIRAGSADIGGGFNLNGGSASLAYNFSDRFSLIGDFGAYRFGDLPSGLSSNLYSYLFGPRYTVRRSHRLVPFAQVLLGGARVTASSGSINAGENAFAASFGAGVDMPLHHQISLRLLQADYLLTRFPNLNGNSATENHVRISAGIVFRFGSR
jgi:Outer membrane protein beta-barrel domain